MSVLLLFFGNQDPIVPDPPLGIGLGSLFSVSGDVSGLFDQTPLSIVADGLSDVLVELFTNHAELRVGSASRIRIVLAAEESMTISVTSTPQAIVHFGSEESFDIFVRQVGESRIKFAEDAVALFFDVAMDSGCRARLEFVRDASGQDALEAGDDTILRYIPFVI